MHSSSIKANRDRRRIVIVAILRPFALCTLQSCSNIETLLIWTLEDQASPTFRFLWRTERIGERVVYNQWNPDFWDGQGEKLHILIAIDYEYFLMPMTTTGWCYHGGADREDLNWIILPRWGRKSTVKNFLPARKLLNFETTTGEERPTWLEDVLGYEIFC